MRNSKNLLKKIPERGFPRSREGHDGELSLNITQNGIGLYGKVHNKWYRFGAAQEVGHKGKINPRNKFLKQDFSIRNLDVDRKISSLNDLTLDVAKGLTLDVKESISLYSTNVNFLDNSNNLVYGFSTGGTPRFTIARPDNTSDYFRITVNAEGATTIITADQGDMTGHLTLAPDGALILDPALQKVIINATDSLYFDGGTDTYIVEGADDRLDLFVGNDRMIRFLEDGNDGNTIDFTNSCAGFAQGAALMDNTNSVADFRHTNKIGLSVNHDIINLKLYFPYVSGNFVLVLKYDGDHDITNWLVFDSDGNAATADNVSWAGGAAMATTSGGTDIVSFYWDAGSETAYGVGSTGFAPV